MADPGHWIWRVWGRQIVYLAATEKFLYASPGRRIVHTTTDMPDII
jgi:hypothetical protein